MTPHSSAALSAPSSTPSPGWEQCELFCINDAAGVAGTRCGWRGAQSETRWDVVGRVRPCPRCGAPTLMELHPVRRHMPE